MPMKWEEQGRARVKAKKLRPLWIGRTSREDLHLFFCERDTIRRSATGLRHLGSGSQLPEKFQNVPQLMPNSIVALAKGLKYFGAVADLSPHWEISLTYTRTGYTQLQASN